MEHLAVTIFKPQLVGSGYKNTVYRYNCRGNYARFYKHKLCKNKEAEIGKNKKKIRKF